jgi:hypothetical protein
VLRSIIAAAAAATAMTLVPAPGQAQAAPAPTYAKPHPDPLAGLALHPEWGSITGRSGVLKRGCHKYTYTYSVQPPEGIWVIEVFISGPKFKHLAAGAFLDGYDPKSGTGHYKLCRVTTRHGRFTIEAKVSADDGSGHITEGRLPADTYRLRPAGR